MDDGPSDLGERPATIPGNERTLPDVVQFVLVIRGHTDFTPIPLGLDWFLVDFFPGFSAVL